MSRPRITEHDASTGETIEREMTEKEYAAVVADGWADEPSEPIE